MNKEELKAMLATGIAGEVNSAIALYALVIATAKSSEETVQGLVESIFANAQKGVLQEIGDDIDDQWMAECTQEVLQELRESTQRKVAVLRRAINAE